MRRRLTTLSGLSAVCAIVVLSLNVGTAVAHHAILSGVASCPGPDHVIDWTIGNSQPKESMTIIVADAVMAGTHYAVTGYASPVAPAGQTAAQSAVDGTLTGTVTLSVRGRWTDGHTSWRHVDVALSDPCSSTTTSGPTTTLPSSTTTSGSSLTSGPGGPSTTLATSMPSTTPGPPHAYTGPGPALIPLGVAGFALVATGLALVVAPSKRKVARER